VVTFHSTDTFYSMDGPGHCWNVQKMVQEVVAGDSYMVWGGNMTFMDGPGHSQNVHKQSGK
jgi:hypothetical protein